MPAIRHSDKIAKSANANVCKVFFGNSVSSHTDILFKLCNIKGLLGLSRVRILHFLLSYSLGRFSDICFLA
uniref:Uncharacterized protein n=1 Tax=Picea sitchensis TaxID=3332 RepID=D5A8Q7_PICSI|nr:unknown [Picea sitchensis]